jgi:hypothetical protein
MTLDVIHRASKGDDRPPGTDVQTERQQEIRVDLFDIRRSQVVESFDELNNNATCYFGRMDIDTSDTNPAELLEGTETSGRRGA